MKEDNQKPVLGISACLIGANVRFDGGAFTHKWIAHELSKYVQYESYCPEVAMGLGVPRDTLRLEYKSDTSKPKLIETKSGADLTNQVAPVAERIFKDLSGLSGFILAKNSPSCGVESVKLYNAKNKIPDAKGQGVFASELIKKEPFLPVVDSGRMHNPVEREKFVKHVMSYHRLKNINPKIKDLQAFHQKHKYMLMEYAPSEVSALGRIAGNSDKTDFEITYVNYITLFSEVMREQPTIKTRRNVFYHLLGYFKNDLDKTEKEHFLELIEQYANGLIPYVALTTHLNLYAKKYKKDYLIDQILFNPYPIEMGLQKFVE